MRVEVSVKHAMRVQVLHPLGDVQGQTDTQGPREQLARPDQILQSTSTDVLYRNIIILSVTKNFTNFIYSMPCSSSVSIFCLYSYNITNCSH